MRGADIFLSLQAIFGDGLTMDDVEKMIPKIAVWHTHPGGNVGPSRADMQSKPDHFQNLVVALRGDEPPLATWF
jgi:proteasome lid subunit RPN8/RPN11